MKILRIRLRNLASLAGTHSVEFTREPLASAGLFAISGPTGSGKSTLLDALCLALYEDSPRLAGAKGAPLPDAGEVIQPGDPANLLRRGASEGFAEVAFVGIDGQIYTARWSVRRARQRVEGSLQRPEMALYRGDVVEGVGGELIHGGRKTEVLAAIREKVGLSFDQFTRAVLLAQGEFAVFLKASDGERALILQALTGSERFERLSIAAFERKRLEQQAVKDIEGRLEGQAPMAPDLRATAEQVRDMAAHTVDAARRAVEQRTAQAQWFEQHREFERTLAEVTQRHQTAIQSLALAAPRRAELNRATEVVQSAQPLYRAEQEAKLQQVEAHRNRLTAEERAGTSRTRVEQAAHAVIAARARLDQARAGRDAAAPLLEQARVLDAQLIPATARLATARQERETAEVRLFEATRRTDASAVELAALRQRAESLELQRAKDLPLAPCLPEAAGWIERLGSALRARSLRDAAHTRATRAGEAVQRWLTDIASLKPTHALLLEATTTATQDHAARLEALKAFNPDGLSRERQSLDAALVVLSETHHQLGIARDLGRQIEEAMANTFRLGESIATDTLALATVRDRQLPSAEVAWVTSRDLLANAQAAVEHAAGSLRAGLREQQPCPVCGALEHPYAAHAPTADAVLASLSRAEADRRGALDLLRAESTRLETRLKSATTELGLARTALDALRQRRDVSRQLAFSPPMVAAWRSLAEDQALETVSQQIQQETQRRVHLQQQEDRYRKALAETDAARVQLEGARLRSEVEGRKLTELERSLAAANAAETADRAAAAQALQADADAFAPLLPVLERLPVDEQEQVRNTPAVALPQLQSRIQSLAETESHLQGVRREIELNRVRAEAEGREHQAAQTGINQTRAAEQEAIAVQGELQLRRQALLGGRSVEEENRRIEGEVTSAETASATATGIEATASKDQAAAVETVRTSFEAALRADERVTVAVQALDVWLAGFSDRSGVVLDRSYLGEVLSRGEVWLAGEQSALAELSRASDTLQGECAARAAARAEHLQRRPTEEAEPVVLTDLEQRRDQLKQAEDRRLEAETVLAEDNRRRIQSAELLEQLNAQRTQAGPWERLDELIGSSDGGRFRGIAQRHTLDLLLLDANAQLELIAARYRLERLPASLSLVVIDRDMGDERRGVHSLSGGESFLVSLALALGLASLTSNRIRIESLFIDEGFGSLDPETLNTAMSALMHLESQGRKVGVISHVTEMADAIPVQIRVVRGRGGASRLVVPGQEPAGVGSAGVGPADGEADSAMTGIAVAALAERLLERLRAARAAGEPRVSSTTLRRQLGCESREFNAARVALGSQVISEGRSLSLAEG